MTIDPRQPTLSAARSPRSSPAISLEQARAMAGVKNAANWWYWIAGVTAINSALELFGGGFHFMLGTGITQSFDGLAMHGAPTPNARGIALAADLIVAGLIALWGMVCGKGLRWAFVVGIAVYALDAALVGLCRDWYSLAFHGYALYRIGAGIPDSAQLQRLKAAAQPASAANAQFIYSSTQHPGEWPPAPTSSESLHGR